MEEKKETTSFNAFDFKLEAERETEEFTMDDGNKASTCIPIVPLRDTIIVRGIFEEKPAILIGADEQKIKQLGAISSTVVAVGSEVKDIKVGQTIAMPYNPGIQQIELKSNPRSISKMISHFKNKAKADPSFKTVKLVEYVVAPVYAIKGFYIDSEIGVE